MRLDPRMLFGIVVTLVGVSVTCSLIQGADQTAPYYVAARDLPRGHILQEHDLETARANLVGGLADLAWAARDTSEAGGESSGDTGADSAGDPVAGASPVGWLLLEPMRSGELLIRSNVGRIEPLRTDEAAFTLPIDDDATWRDVAVGDLVRIWLSGRARGEDGRELIFAEPLVVRARLLATRVDEDNAERVNVTLAIPDDPNVLNRLAGGLIAGTHTVYRLSPDADGDDLTFLEAPRALELAPAVVPGRER